MSWIRAVDLEEDSSDTRVEKYVTYKQLKYYFKYFYYGFLWGCRQIYPGSDRLIRLDLIV